MVRPVRPDGGVGMNRFFVTPEAVGGSRIHLTDPDDVHHIRKVLRLKASDRIEISDSTAFEYLAEIEETGPGGVTARILDKQGFAAELSTRVTLFQAVPKQGKMEFIIQKTVELGIAAIVPVETERTVAVEKGRDANRIQRWNKIAAEAGKQCKRGVVPKVGERAAFSEMLKRFSDFDLVLFPYENEENRTLKEALRERAGALRPAQAALVIGPEGGFSPREAAEAAAAGAVTVSLGKTTLRTETAGMAALAMLVYEWEL